MDIRLNLMKTELIELRLVKIYSSKHPQQPLEKKIRHRLRVNNNMYLMANPLNVFPIDL